jgi:hypothetical protein
MLLEARVWIWAVVIRPLKHVLALPALVRLVTPERRSADPARRQLVQRRLSEYLSSRAPFPRRAPGNCLERSLAAFRLLSQAGATPHLAVGVRTGAGGVEGHVWIVLDGEPFAEAGDVGRYAVVVSFDDQGQREATKGRADLSGVRWA